MKRADGRSQAPRVQRPLASIRRRPSTRSCRSRHQGTTKAQAAAPAGLVGLYHGQVQHEQQLQQKQERRQQQQERSHLAGQGDAADLRELVAQQAQLMPDMLEQARTVRHDMPPQWRQHSAAAPSRADSGAQALPEQQLQGPAAAAPVPAAAQQQQRQHALQQQQASWQQGEQRSLDALVIGCGSAEAAAALFVSREQEFTPARLQLLMQRLAACTEPQALCARQRLLLQRLLAAAAARLQQQLATAAPGEIVACLALLCSMGFALPPQELKPALQALGPHLCDLSAPQLAALIAVASSTAVATSASAGGASTSAVGPAHHAGSPVVASSAWLQRFASAFERHLSAKGSTPAASAAPPAPSGFAPPSAGPPSTAAAAPLPAPAAPPPPEALALVIASLADLGAHPSRTWLYVFVRHLGLRMAELTPSQLVRVVVALAALGYRLPDHVLRQFERRVGGDALAALRPGEAAAALRALTGARPDAGWVRQALVAVLRGSSHLDAHTAVGLIAVAATLGGAPPDWLDVLLLQARGALASLAAGDHVALIGALGAAQHRPGPGFMADFLHAVQPQLGQLTLHQLSALLCGLAAAHTRPSPQWMRAAVGSLARGAPAPNDYPDLLRLLGALARLRYTASADMLARLEAQVDRLALLLDFRQTQALRGALAALEYNTSAGPVAAQQGASPGEAGPGGVAAAAAAASSLDPTPRAAASGDSVTVGGGDSASIQQDRVLPFGLVVP